MVRVMLSGSMLGLFLQVVPVTALVGVVYAIFRYRYIRRRGRFNSWGTEFARLLFVCYVTGLVNLVLTPNNLWTAIWFYLFNGYDGGVFIGPLFTLDYNLVPTLFRCLAGELTLGSWVKAMLAGNVLMFVPMGVLLPFAFPTMSRRALPAAAVAIPMVIELLQPIVGRSLDIDDLLANCIGILLGYLLAGVWAALWKHWHRN